MATKTKKTFKWPSGTKGHTRSWADEQKRIKTTKLSAPIVPGSSVTERDLAKAATSASTVKYSPLEAQQQQQFGQAQTAQRDIGGPGGFYDQYLKQLAENAANVNSIAAQANQAVAGTQNAVTGLAGADLSQLQGQANAGAAARGMGPAGDLSGMASNAAAIRQALVGSFGAQQAARGAAAQTYAGGLANVVGPTQKLAGQAIAQGKVTAAQKAKETTAREKGAYESQYKEEQRASESKNVLAQQIATGKTAADLAKANLASKTSIKTANIRADTALTTAQAASQAAADKAAAKGNEPNKYGVPAGQWASWSTSHRKRVMDAQGGGGSGKGGKGPDWVTPNESGAAMTQLTGLKSMAQKAKQGLPFKQYSPEDLKKWKKVPKSRADAEKKILGFAPVSAKLKHPILVRAAVDAIYDGHISAYTVKGLIAAGYKPSEVARTLGVPTSVQWKAGQPARDRARTQANTGAYGKASPQPQGHY